MTQNEVQGLWEAVDRLREQVAAQGTVLAEIKALLSERCSAREARLATAEGKVAGLAERSWFERGRDSAIGAAVGAMAAMAVKAWAR